MLTFITGFTTCYSQGDRQGEYMLSFDYQKSSQLINRATRVFF
jgi:hypothetical protein